MGRAVGPRPRVRRHLDDSRRSDDHPAHDRAGAAPRGHRGGRPRHDAGVRRHQAERRGVMTAHQLMLVGGGGHGSDTLDLVLRALPDVEVAGVLDDELAPSEAVGRLSGRGLRVIGPVTRDALGQAQFVIGVGYPNGRASVLARLPAEQAVRAIVDPTAVVSPTATLEPGVAVFWGASVSPNVVIGAHAFVSYGATVGHESTVGACTAVMPGARVSGDVIIGAGVVVGTGAVILEGVSVGDGARIGAGSVVTRDVDAGATVRGVPAR